MANTPTRTVRVADDVWEGGHAVLAPHGVTVSREVVAAALIGLTMLTDEQLEQLARARSAEQSRIRLAHL